MTVVCDKLNCFYNVSKFCTRETLTLRLIANGAAVCDLFATRNGMFDDSKEKPRTTINIENYEVKDNDLERTDETNEFAEGAEGQEMADILPESSEPVSELPVDGDTGLQQTIKEGD